MEEILSLQSKVEKQAQSGGDKTAKRLLEILNKYKTVLLQGHNAREIELDNKDDKALAKELFLLTDKPVLYVCNVDDEKDSHDKHQRGT